jgi:transposase
MPKSKYPKEFKIRAVRLSEQDDMTCVEVAEDLDINVHTLYSWREKYKKHGDDAFPGTGNQTPEDERIAELEKEVEKLKNERYVLKKAISIFSD